MVIYLDDLKMAGPENNLKQGWKLLRKGLLIEPEKPVNMFLGRAHIRGAHRLANGVCVTTRTYGMEEFRASCVELYLKLAPLGTRLRKVGTPFLGDAEDSRHGPPSKPI